MNDLPFDPDIVSFRLLIWYGQSGRDLPWRNTRDPYRIWLSEVMLQQTTVTAVIYYYLRFLERFPTIEQLAVAPLEDVIDLWAGLGYYSRARNLHAAAKLVFEQFKGHFPEDVKALQRLPGVGRSTAGAIAALAFDKRAAILDGNVRRILCRLFSLQELPRSTVAEKQLWRWAELLTPDRDVHDYTQAIMDLGATVCLPRKPLCNNCPLNRLCQARKLGLEQQLPLKQVVKKIPLRKELALLLKRQDCYLVRRRPATGFLGGLWEFPTISLSEGDEPEQKLRLLLTEFGPGGTIRALGNIRHVYSHFRLELQLFQVSIEELPLIAEGETEWFPLRQLENLALHGAHKKALGQLPNLED